MVKSFMNLNRLPIDPRIIDVLHEQNISTLYPPQETALPPVLNGKNVVLSVPTASGKSLVAYLAIVHRLLSEGGKALYVVPLIALAKEKYEELLSFETLGLRVGISTGDLDDSDPRLSRYDIIVCTSEKADSLLRHGVKWMEEVKVLVIDEIHLIHDADRGPTLEVLIARFRALNPETQVIALSATIKNAMDLAVWLNAELVQSNWRPVPLKEGVYYNRKITYDNGEIEEVQGNEKQPLLQLVEQSLQSGGQVLVFVNTRRSTVSVAQQLAGVVAEKLSDEEKQMLAEIIMTMQRYHVEQTSVDKTLSACIKKGVAFHHAGLSSFQRKTVEQGFKNHVIKCIVATPTLAAGVNIPAQRVIIRDLWRYDPNFGMKPIPVLEYKQQAGRAGRPRYDSEGQAITIAKDESTKHQILESYVYADTEPIYSKLGNQMALRMHLLAAISTGFVRKTEDIYRFIDQTFYACQADASMLRDEIDQTLYFLEKNGFIECMGDLIHSTVFGQRTSALYVDPMSALVIKKALENLGNRKIPDLSFLHMICSTPDVRSLYLRRGDDWVEEIVDQHRNEFLIDVPLPSEEEYEWFLSDLKTALLLSDWIDERSEEQLILRYGVGPGDIHNIVETAQWILHAAREFARMYDFSHVPLLGDLILRVRYGCRKELLDLVSLKGIGRIRARSLFNEGFKTVNDLRGVPLNRLAAVPAIGHRIAKSIKEQIGEETIGETDLSEFPKDTKKAG